MIQNKKKLCYTYFIKGRDIVMKSKRFKTKHKFFAIILAFCFIIPTLLTGCSFGGNPDNGDNPPEQSSPTLTIGTDSQLVYSEANSRYEISLYAGATYTLDVMLMYGKEASNRKQ